MLISKNLHHILTSYPNAESTIDAINELCEYPRYSWVRSMLNDVPLSLVGERKMVELLAEIKKREDATRLKFWFIHE